LTGGQRPKDISKGWFYEPTVLTGVNHSMLIMREETFGPAVPLMEYTSFEEAIDLVNDCQYGLGAVLLSEDPQKIKTFFEDVKAGTIWINDPLTDNYAGPFGGMKYSGVNWASRASTNSARPNMSIGISGWRRNRIGTHTADRRDVALQRLH
jgi:betaine-aldehyde dehydrogenase